MINVRGFDYRQLHLHSVKRFRRRIPVTFNFEIKCKLFIFIRFVIDLNYSSQLCITLIT
jgi:hypothetical protein